MSRGFIDRPSVGRGETVRFAQGGESAPSIQPAGVLFAEAAEGGVLLQNRGAAAGGELERRAQVIPETTVVGPPIAAAPE
jgi:hypothetical protein